MITKKHLEIYKAFNRDIDAWGRSGSHDSNVFPDDIWYTIEGLIQNLIIIKNGHASQNFITQTLQQIKQECESDDVREDLIYLSKECN